ncbi:MAG: prolipoprotein diacylglyceryl transferase [Candidatus Gracilibacteria bacterium]|nr:prolipoprotein diacylglyceryl transferase [Candidatus Gracilibacteria bacterium]
MNLFQLGFGVFALKIYGLLVAIFFCLAAWHFYRYLQKNGFPTTFFVHHFWRWVLGGVLVGRVVSLFLDPSLFAEHGLWSFFLFWRGELYFYASLLGGLACMAWDLRQHQMKFWRWLDAGVASFLIAILGIDLAGFITGHVYGKETALPWGVQYETFGVDILEPVHPVTLYAFLLHLLLLRWVAGNLKTFSHTPGRLAKLTALMFFAFDFFLQFLRADATVMLSEQFRLAQGIDFALVVACVVALRRHRKPVE